MWLQLLLIFAVRFARGILHSVHQPGEEELQTPTEKLQDDLSKCLGDHYKMMLSYPPPPDLNTVESIKSMLGTEDYVTDFFGMHMQAGSAVSIARWFLNASWTESDNKTAWVEILHKATETFIGINFILRDIEILDFAVFNIWEYGPSREFVNYSFNRTKIRSLRYKWASWMLRPTDAARFDVFAGSCAKNDMVDWFASLHGDNKWPKKKLRGPPLFKDGDMTPADRSLYTYVARYVKSDMCEATMLLGACDEVLSSSNQIKEKHMTEVFEVYKRFADVFTEKDRDFVTNARNLIEWFSKAAASNWKMWTSPNALPYPEQFRRLLKQRFYWLDFTVIIFHLPTQYPEQLAYGSSCALSLNLKHRSCMSGYCIGSWDVVVYVADPLEDANTHEPTWTAVKRVVDNCNATVDKSILNATDPTCDASELFANATELTYGVPVPSYLATYRSYDISELPRGIQVFKTFSYYTNMSQPYGRGCEGGHCGWQWLSIQHKLTAAAPCDRDIYTY